MKVQMSRSAIWLSILGITLLGLTTLWFLTNFERVPYDVPTYPSSEARRNPYLAAQRLTQAYGYTNQVDTETKMDLVNQLARKDTLILGQAREYSMTQDRSQKLLHWVQQGGYLILETGYGSHNDHLLAELDISVLTGQEAESDDERSHREAREEKARQTHQQLDAKEQTDTDTGQTDTESGHQNTFKTFTVPVNIPGYGRTLHFPTGYQAIAAGDVVPSWSAETNERARILHFQYGQGNITVVNCFCQFNNQRLNEGDHAELLLGLLHTYQPHGKILWIQHLYIPSLWEWLAEYAAPALWSAALLLMVWLWRIIPRFAVLRQEAVVERRSLLEHLRAIGRYLWRTRSLDVLLTQHRQVVFALMQRRVPAIAALTTVDQQEQSRQLSQLVQISAQRVYLSLHESLSHPEQFTQAIQTLKQLEHALQQGNHHGHQ